MTNSGLYKWSKHKKLIILASKRARTVLNAFLECMYMAKLIWMDKISVYYTVSFGNNKNSGYFRHFRHMSKFLIISLVLLRLSQKSKAEIRRLIFNRFLTVKILVRSIFAKGGTAKFFVQPIALICAQKQKLTCRCKNG